MNIELMNEIMHNPSIPFMERMATVRKMRRDHEDSQENVPFLILEDEEDVCELLASLEQSEPYRDVDSVRVFFGQCHNEDTLIIQTLGGQAIVIGTN